MIFSRKTDKERIYDASTDEWIDLTPVGIEEPAPLQTETKTVELHQVTPTTIEPPQVKTEPVEPPKSTFEPSQPKIDIPPVQIYKPIQAEKVAVKEKEVEKKLEEGSEIDYRLEKLMPGSEPKKHSTPTLAQTKQVKVEPPPKDIKPWEIDLRGRPLAQKDKEPTAYEKWIDERRQKEGITVECPKCGAKNVDLPFVTGEKCRNCGFAFEEFEDVGEKMAVRDEKFGVFGATRLSLGFNDAPGNLAASLAIPRILVENPIPAFEFVFTTSAAMVRLLYIVCYIVGSFLILPAVFQTHSALLVLIMLVLITLLGIGLISGFASAARVTTIRVDEKGATFSGWAATSSMDYANITAIRNERELNSNVRYRDMGSFLYQILMFFIFGWWYFLFRSRSDYYESTFVDDSSSTLYRTNNISVIGHGKSVSYSFIGYGNLQFIRALAIIVFMAKKRNHKCRIDPAVFKAAEKGDEHYQMWRGYHGE